MIDVLGGVGVVTTVANWEIVGDCADATLAEVHQGYVGTGAATFGATSRRGRTVITTVDTARNLLRLV